MPTPLETKIEPVFFERPIYARPAGVAPIDVDIVVFANEMTAPAGQAYFAYSEADYLAMAAWLQNILRFIKAQNTVIDAYETEAYQNNTVQQN